MQMNDCAVLSEDKEHDTQRWNKVERDMNKKTAAKREASHSIAQHSIVKCIQHSNLKATLTVQREKQSDKV